VKTGVHKGDRPNTHKGENIKSGDAES